MAQRSPTLIGLGAIFRTPSLWLVEVAWRWTFGAGTALLLFLSGVEFLHAVEVPESDLLFLQSKNPLLVAAALSDVFQGGGARLLRVVAVLIPTLAAFWMFAATIGRTATLKVLLPGSKPRLRALLGLSFLRAASTVAALLAIFTAFLLASLGSAIPADAARAAAPVFRLLVAVTLVILVPLVWAVLNWVLSLAAVFAARDQVETITAIEDAIRLYGRRAKAFWAAGVWFGLLHGLAAVGASFAAMLALMLTGVSPVAGLIALAGLIGVYLAVADFLYIARLAAYVAIAEDNHLLQAVTSPASLPPDTPGSTVPIQAGP